MRRPSRRGKHVINSKKSKSPVSQSGRVTKTKLIRSSKFVKTGLFSGYFRKSDGLSRNARLPTLSLNRPILHESHTKQCCPVDSGGFDSTKWWVMSSALGQNTSSENGHCRSKGNVSSEKLKRKDSKKEKKSGKKSDKESSFLRDREKAASFGASTRQSRSRKKAIGLFNCAGGQRSRSCTPERNATLSCRIPVSLDLESLDLQLAEIMAKQRDFSREYVCRQEPEEGQNDKDSDSENPKPSFFGGIRKISLRRRKSMTKTTTHRKHGKGDLPIVHNEPPDLGRDTISTTSTDSGISSSENSINRRGDGDPSTCSRPLSYNSRTTFNRRGDSTAQPTAAVVRMGIRRLDKRPDVGRSGSEQPSFPLQNRQLPQPSLIRTNIKAAPPKQDITLVKTILLDKVLKHKWISGIAVTRKFEYVVVDMREAYLLDEEGNPKRTIGGKGNGRLFEPISVSVMSNGNLLFSDHSEQDVKIYNSKGQFVGRVQDKGLVNIAGVAANVKREIFIAGTDKGRVSVHNEGDQLLFTIPPGGQSKSIWEHPYSIAINPLTGDVLVGDDNKQLVTAVTYPDGKLLWKFSPVGNRHFFPSSICADENGYVFIADLYNEKVYMLDSSGKFLKTILSRGAGLKGGPGAIAVDGRGHLVVADEERTLKVFKYGENGFTMYRRTSQYCPGS